MAHQLLLTLTVDSSRTKSQGIMEKKELEIQCLLLSTAILLTLEKGTMISHIKFSLDSQKSQFSATQKKTCPYALSTSPSDQPVFSNQS